MIQPKKYQQFKLSCGLRPSTTEMCQWILRRAHKISQVKPVELEIDLKLFNRDIAKWRGKPYDRKTLREAIAQLDSDTKGWFTIIKSYTPWIHKIMVRPLDMVLQRNSQDGDKPPKPPTGNPMFDSESKKRSNEQLLQNISKLDNLFQKLGMHYTRDALLRIWRMAGKKMSEVTKAVEYMLQCHSRQIEQSSNVDGEARGVRTPKGWLHRCLEYGWHDNIDDTIDLPYFDSTWKIFSFVRDISPPLQTE